MFNVYFVNCYKKNFDVNLDKIFAQNKKLFDLLHYRHTGEKINTHEVWRHKPYEYLMNVLFS